MTRLFSTMKICAFSSHYQSEFLNNLAALETSLRHAHLKRFLKETGNRIKHSELPFISTISHDNGIVWNFFVVRRKTSRISHTHYSVVDLGFGRVFFRHISEKGFPNGNRMLKNERYGNTIVWKIAFWNLRLVTMTSVGQGATQASWYNWNAELCQFG